MINYDPIAVRHKRVIAFNMALEVLALRKQPFIALKQKEIESEFPNSLLIWYCSERLRLLGELEKRISINDYHMISLVLDKGDSLTLKFEFVA